MYLPLAPASDYSNLQLRAISTRIVYQRSGERCTPLLVSLATNEPTWCHFPQSPSSPGSKDCSHNLPTICHTPWGFPPGPCFGCVRSPYPLNHCYFCCWLQALSLVLRLGKYRAYKPVGCPPTTKDYVSRIEIFLTVLEARSLRSRH